MDPSLYIIAFVKFAEFSELMDILRFKAENPDWDPMSSGRKHS